MAGTSSSTRKQPASIIARYNERCLVAPAPEIRQQLLQRYSEIKRTVSQAPAEQSNSFLQSALRPIERRHVGFNDGVVRPPSTFRPGMSLAAQLAERAPLRGTVNVVVVMVDFADKKFTASQTKAHFATLWFQEGSNSVRDYYRDVSNGAVTITVRMIHYSKLTP